MAVLYVVLNAVLLFATPATNLMVSISAPQDNAVVPHRPFVEGTVSDNTASIFVIVHPMETSEYWVEPKPTVRKNGIWRVQIYVGDAGAAHKGKHFEVMAVANAQRKLKEGQKLDDWPSAQARSEVLEVVRR